MSAARDRQGCELSVVIPVYNPGPLLREQLAALTQQRVEVGWEVVLADNGCTDGSLAAVQELPTSFPLRVIDASARRGPSFARNAGVAAARGSWVAFCDSDDVVDREWLSRLWDARVLGEIVCGAWDVKALNDTRELKARGGPDYGTALPDGPCGFLPYAPSCNVLLTRALFDKLGGWDESLPYCEDVDLSWRAQLAGASLGFAADAVVKYRFRSSLPAMMRQIRRYKATEALLFRRYRSRGARRPTFGEAFGRYWWLLSRAPYLVLDRERRVLWFAIMASVIGRLEGTLRYRVVYL